MQQCPFCKMMVMDGASVCTACGAWYGLPSRQNNPQMYNIVMIMMALTAGLAFCGRFGRCVAGLFLFVLIIWAVLHLRGISRKMWWRRD